MNTNDVIYCMIYATTVDYRALLVLEVHTCIRVVFIREILAHRYVGVLYRGGASIIRGDLFNHRNLYGVDRYVVRPICLHL